MHYLLLLLAQLCEALHFRLSWRVLAGTAEEALQHFRLSVVALNPGHDARQLDCKTGRITIAYDLESFHLFLPS